MQHAISSSSIIDDGGAFFFFVVVDCVVPALLARCVVAACCLSGLLAAYYLSFVGHGTSASAALATLSMHSIIAAYYPPAASISDYPPPGSLPGRRQPNLGGHCGPAARGRGRTEPEKRENSATVSRRRALIHRNLCAVLECEAHRLPECAPPAKKKEKIKQLHSAPLHGLPAKGSFSAGSRGTG